MNLAAFAVIVVRERETEFGDDIKAVQGLGRDRPALAWPLTISMLALAGLPATAGFIGKLYLIEAAVEADYTWLGVAIAIGTMISLAYYLRVVAAIWMRPAAEPLAPAPAGMPAMAGGSPEADEGGSPDAGTAAPPGTRCRVILMRPRRWPGRRSSSASSPPRWSTGPPNAGQALAPFIRLSRTLIRARVAGAAARRSPRRAPGVRGGSPARSRRRTLEQLKALGVSTHSAIVHLLEAPGDLDHRAYQYLIGWLRQARTNSPSIFRYSKGRCLR